MLRNYLILMVGLVFFCCQPPKELPDPPGPPLPGAYQMTSYLPLLQSKRVAVCTNHTGLIGETHLIDSLMKRGVNVTKVFTPEHGFRGFADAGEHVEYKEQELPFQLVSLYGQHRKPTADDMENLDVVVFDIQDVGARFYTYISTMTYVMEACASSGIPFVVLDRPNPNGSYVDGPVLEAEHKSFVGLHPVPIVHGLTPGEFAQMINGEGWLEGGLRCDLTVISCTDWEHHTRYSLPVRPSPNLPDDHSIALYPSLCLFEQTLCSVGRGTAKAFQHIGHPAYPDTTYFFVPESLPGAMNPRFKGEKCFGVDYATDQPV
ncbi:MAG: DUF1343 domain-containing protein, partial [Bacteroidota bacterium]